MRKEERRERGKSEQNCVDASTVTFPHASEAGLASYICLFKVGVGEILEGGREEEW